MQSEQLNELAAALSKAQGTMTNATMNRTNPHFKSKYADLASVLDAIRKPLSENGLSTVQTMEIREGGMVLRTMLMHTSGQWIASEYPLPATARPQEMGSAQTYARRYSLAAIICNSADEDDDATQAENGKQRIDSRGRAPAKPAPNVMIEPPHDPDTGEIIEPAPTAEGHAPAPTAEGHAADPAAPASTSPAGAAGALTAEDADKQLAEAAKLGTAQLARVYKSLPQDLQDAAKVATNRRHKPAALKADQARLAAHTETASNANE